ncbi:Hypothetical protein PHPALM_36129 [Phytophthora palmivora]|uniref:HTH CENPB-type domain-containing protein n=1 Tax=Phytophthora palmivora TaxID=4796 RepID=A0A2P4X0P7_9STRA|nr:Hypothetical protein PHPALM_36129 [Phytophthora palmivora]
MARHRHRALTTEQRLAIVRQSDKKPEWRQKQLGQWAADTFQLDFVPSQPTISLVLRHGGKPVKVRQSAVKAPPKPKVIKCPRVEKAMLQWLELKIAQDEAVTLTNVQTQAQMVVDKLKVTVDGFVVSDAWVDSFVRHHVLNCSFGLSDSETTDGDEEEEVKVGKSRRMLDLGKDSNTPVTKAPAGKRKRDNRGREPTRQSLMVCCN